MTFGERLKDMAHNIGYSMGVQSQKYSNTFLDKQKDRQAYKKTLEMSTKQAMTASQRFEDTKHNIKYKVENAKVAASETREHMGMVGADIKYELKTLLHKLNPFKGKDSSPLKYEVSSYEAIDPTTMDKKSPVFQRIEREQQDLREGIVRPTKDTIEINETLGEQGVEMKSVKMKSPEDIEKARQQQALRESAGDTMEMDTTRGEKVIEMTVKNMRNTLVGNNRSAGGALYANQSSNQRTQ